MARVIISIPEQLLSQIDQVAESECRTRSELLREGFRLYMKLSLLQRQMEANDAQETSENG